MKNITPRMFRRTLTTLALTSMLASLTACTGTTTAMDPQSGSHRSQPRPERTRTCPTISSTEDSTTPT